MSTEPRTPKTVLVDLMQEAPGPEDSPADRIEWLWAMADQLAAAGMPKLAETAYLSARRLLAELVDDVAGKAGA
ncbi:hypothetical protein [Amycolatopsis sp. YIM 10]|uniref:hypothetical protein n=1 Tax=Amycolatopsis sp. YIM 10 TaxID=2653857 RepID=UPI00129023B8|nr:hypothetical protein [Amycolatopsis sp. YIM 10]QFU85726.1 hypothetical protein YIM_02505 [Amycolatopsis sp. YIM 10]